MITALIDKVVPRKARKEKHIFFEQIEECLITPHQKPVWFQGNALGAGNILKKSSIDVIITSPHTGAVVTITIPINWVKRIIL